MATDLTAREAATAVAARQSALQAETVQTSFGPARALGHWSALLASWLTVIFVALTIAFPAGEWGGIDRYARTFETIQVVQLVPVLLLAPVVVVLMACIHQQAAAESRLVSHIAVVFAGLYAAVIVTNYVLQLTVVRSNVQAGSLDGLVLLAGSNPRSVFAAMEIVGYGFFSLMALFAGVTFPRGGSGGWIRRLFILSGVTGCVGAVAGLLDLRTLMLSGFGLSLVAFLVTVVLLSRHFKRQGAT